MGIAHRRSPRHLLILVCGACLLSLGGLPSGRASAAACSSPLGGAVCLGEGAAPFVTPADADRIARELWNAQERANTTKDASLYRAVDTGPALFRKLYAVDDLHCGCGKFYWTKGTRTIRSLSLYLPAQSRYPLYFMASVLAEPAAKATPTSGVTSIFFVTRSDPSQSWRISMILFDDGYDKPSPALEQPLHDSSGYEVAPSSVSAGQAEKWPKLLAAYYTSLKETGAPPVGTRFLPGSYTTGTDLTERRQGYTNSSGVIAHYRFTVGAPPWVFSLYGATTCAPILEYVTQKWTKPHTVFEQVDGQSPNWGPDLNTGYYSTIVVTYEWTVCITSEANGLDVWGPTGGGEPIHTGGIPATPAPGTTRVL